MVQISTQRLRGSEFFGKHTLRPLCSLRLLPPQNSKLSTPTRPSKYSAINSQNTETKRKYTKFTIKLQLSYTPAKAWPHRFHVRLMADTFVFNHVEQAEHIAMPHYLSLHDLHGLSNLNRTKYHSEGLVPTGSVPTASVRAELALTFSMVPFVAAFLR